MNTVTAIAPLEISRVLDTSLADTWNAWTDPELVSLWFAPGAMRAEVFEFDVRPEGKYRVCMRDEDGSTHTVGGRFLEARYQQRLVMTWAWEGSDAPESKVTVTFAAHGDGTRIDVLHEGLISAESVAAHREGWEACLDKLPRPDSDDVAS